MKTSLFLAACICLLVNPLVNPLVNGVWAAELPPLDPPELTQLEQSRAKLKDRQRSFTTLIQVAEQLKTLSTYDPALMSLLDGELDAAHIKSVVAAMAGPKQKPAPRPAPKPDKPPALAAIAPQASHLLYAQAQDTAHQLMAKAVVQPGKTAHTIKQGESVVAGGHTWNLTQVVEHPSHRDRLLVTFQVNNQPLVITYPQL